MKTMWNEPEQKQERQRGFALLILVLALMSMILLVLLGLERRLLISQAEQQRRNFFLQEFSATNAALSAALHISWEMVTTNWQCQQSHSVELCLRASGTNVLPTTTQTTAPIALLRARRSTKNGPVLYRFVSMQKKRPPAHSINWVPGGWFDSCPEHDTSLCD